MRRGLAAASSALAVVALIGFPAHSAPAVAAPASAGAAAAASGAPAARRPAARINATGKLLTTGRVHVLVTSNARHAQVRYRTASGTRRTVTKRLTRRTARFTLPRGAQSIRARGKATPRLRASAWMSVSLPSPVAPPAVPAIPEPPPTATPVPLPTTPTVARSSGPAGYSTAVFGLHCPSAPSGQKAVWVVIWPDGRIASIYWSSEGRPLGGFTVPAYQPVGPARVAVDCRYILADQALDAARSAPVVVAYPFDVTVNAPQPTLVADVDHAQPGQVIQVTQVGDCGNQPTAGAYWWLSASDGSINPTILGEPPVGPTGAWGPVSITLPATPMPSGSWYQLTATCTAADQNSWVGYAPLRLPVG